MVTLDAAYVQVISNGWEMYRNRRCRTILSVLQQAGLIQVEKYGQWSYFSRNEALIQQYIEHLQRSL